MAKETISANGGAERYWRNDVSGMRAVLCRNGKVLISRGRYSRWQVSRVLNLEGIALDPTWHSDNSTAARAATARTTNAARRRQEYD